MGRKPSCTPVLRGIIVNMYCAMNRSMADIAQELKISKTMVFQAIKAYGQNGTLENSVRRKRQRKTTETDDRAIVRLSKKDPFLTAPMIHRAMQPQISQNISSRTIQRRLAEVGLRGCIARRKPLVSKINIAKRLNFARQHLKKSLSFWQNVLWSDESKFNLLGSDGKTYVRRPQNQSLNPRYTIKTLKHGGGNIMVWGAFSWRGVGPLVLVQGRMDQYQYKEILEKHMMPYFVDKMDDGRIFQHDNDPKHTARSVKSYLNEATVSVLEWPPQSPDLNPIENLWSHVERQMEGRKYRSSVELFESVTEIWKSIPADVCRKLVDSMHKRCQEVLRNKGYPIKY